MQTFDIASRLFLETQKRTVDEFSRWHGTRNFSKDKGLLPTRSLNVVSNTCPFGSIIGRFVFRVLYKITTTDTFPTTISTISMDWKSQSTRYFWMSLDDFQGFRKDGIGTHFSERDYNKMEYLEVIKQRKTYDKKQNTI
jgi:hypothetical protein